MPTPTSPEPPAKQGPTPAEVIDALGRGEVAIASVSALSDLDRTNARFFAASWPSFPLEARIDVVRQCSELAENDVRYHFGRVLRVALEDTSPVVRQLAVSALWEDEGTDLIATFVRLMRNDDSTDVRAEAASALGRFADLGASDELTEDQTQIVREALTDAASSEEQPPLVQRRALESLASIGDRTLVGALIDVAYDSDDTVVRASAVYAMGKTMDRHWLPTVLAELDSDDPELRYEAARASGELGSIEAVGPLAQLLLDGDTDVRQAAVLALGRIGGPGAIRVLRNYAASCPPGDQEVVDDALAEAAVQSDALKF